MVMAALAGKAAEAAGPGAAPAHHDLCVSGDQAASAWVSNLWQNGEVPYEFDPALEEHKQDSLLHAMTEWETVAEVNFRPRKEGDECWMWIQEWDGQGSNSATGRVEANQRFKINENHWDNRWIMVHELGHTLGLGHTHNRGDRDLFVEVFEDNICPGSEGNFETYDDRDFYGDYDFDSVMHYGRNTFCISKEEVECGSPCQGMTLDVREPWHEEWSDQIGHYGSDDRGHLSFWDQRIISFLYSPSDFRFVRSDAEGEGSGVFLDPWADLEAAVQQTPEAGTLWIQNHDQGTAPYEIEPQVWTRPLLIKASWKPILIH